MVGAFFMVVSVVRSCHAGRVGLRGTGRGDGGHLGGCESAPWCVDFEGNLALSGVCRLMGPTSTLISVLVCRKMWKSPDRWYAQRYGSGRPRLDDLALSLLHGM